MTERAAFGLLHPAVQHHIVNSLGWRSLRPVQEQSIEPILRGDHTLVVAGTAGGKTESAVFPLLSRMLDEEWNGLSVLYICPLRALLNNLHERIDAYCELVGRRAGLWHGDVGPAARKRLLADPPDILLTTPESLESMLVSTGVDERAWFAGVRAVVIDEAHAFVGDDRGWHLLAVVERVSRLSGRDLQRIALSATIGNPHDVLAHLTRTSSAPATVVSTPTGSSTAQVELDYVGTIENAAIVISRLHRGEKRLVFVDSRAAAERLAALLRSHGVHTFVSHGSLGVDERRSAERAFAEARDCVIVATSTLELGIDVGDLDRVIQLDAPSSVASFLQRLGRTGRRPGTHRNALFLATSEHQFLRCAGLLVQWSRGFVEPIVPPPQPFHLVAQQALALSLQEGAIGRHRWTEHLGSPFLFGPEAAAAAPQIIDFLVQEEYLVDDGGLLSIGGTAEDSFGHKHFLELLAVFTSPPLLSVRHARTEIGLVPDEVLLVRPAGFGGGGPPTLLLAGRTWAVTHVDWPRRIVQVEPAEGEGVAKWFGGGSVLSAAVAEGIRHVLTGTDPEGVALSDRARVLLASQREEYGWVPAEGSVLRHAHGKLRLWTFAGWRTNAWVAAALRPFRESVSAFDGLAVALDPDATADAVRAAIHAIEPRSLVLDEAVERAALDGLKFAACLPPGLASATLDVRLRADDAVAAVRDAAVAVR